MYQVRKKKRAWPWLMLLFLCAFAVGLGIGYGSIKMNRQRNLNSVVQEAPAHPSPSVTPEPNLAAAVTTMVPAESVQPGVAVTYFVQEEAGEVCVFSVNSAGERRFSHKLPIALNDLRPEDRALFKQGISVSTRQELLELTEDFSS